MASKRLSGLQKDVIYLYRETLRVAMKKDKQKSLESNENIHTTPFFKLMYEPKSSLFFARSEFRKQANSVKRSDFRTIEYSLRKGKKHIKLMEMPGVKIVRGTN